MADLALFPAIRAALDTLGIAPPGHRDTPEEAVQKLAAWTALKDAANRAELGLLAEHGGSAFTQYCHPENEANAGYVQGLRYALDRLGIEVPEPPYAPVAEYHPPALPNTLSTGYHHGENA